MDSPVSGPWTIKREHPRYLIDIRLVVRTTQLLHGRTKNLSEGGLGATIAGDMQLGSLVRLEFQLPDAPEMLSVHAEVRYRQGFQFGFRFINQTDGQRQIIRRATRALQLDVTSR